MIEDNIQFTKISKELIEKYKKCKVRYFMNAYKSLPKMAEEEGVKLPTLKKWVNCKHHGQPSWASDRGNKSKWVLDQAAKRSLNKTQQAYDIAAELGFATLKLLLNGVNNGKFEGEELLKVMKEVTSFTKVIHPVLRLDEGKSTVNIETHNADPTGEEQARLAYDKDPFGVPEIEVLQGDPSDE